MVNTARHRFTDSMMSDLAANLPWPHNSLILATSVKAVHRQLATMRQRFFDL